MALDGTADSPPRAGLRGRLPELRLSDLFPDSFAVPPIATGSDAVAGAAATKAGAMIVDLPSTPLLEEESPDHDDPSSFSTDLEALRAAATGGPDKSPAPFCPFGFPFDAFTPAAATGFDFAVTALASAAAAAAVAAAAAAASAAW